MSPKLRGEENVVVVCGHFITLVNDLSSDGIDVIVKNDPTCSKRGTAVAMKQVLALTGMIVAHHFYHLSVY